jgi:hypothetical protein
MDRFLDIPDHVLQHIFLYGPAEEVRDARVANDDVRVVLAPTSFAISPPQAVFMPTLALPCSLGHMRKSAGDGRPSWTTRGCGLRPAPPGSLGPRPRRAAVRPDPRARAPPPQGKGLWCPPRPPGRRAPSEPRAASTRRPSPSITPGGCAPTLFRGAFFPPRPIPDQGRGRRWRRSGTGTRSSC